MTPKTPTEQHLEVIEDAERILEDYHRTAPIETFSASHGDRHSTELAMRGARLVTANETDEGRRWAESRINMLTGGEPVRARFMRQDLFEFTFTAWRATLTSKQRRTLYAPPKAR